MTTETEALRAQFEREIGEAAPFPVQRYGDSYAHRICAWAWEGYQAGHAAAKAETAAAVAAERERAATVCERIADDYNEREGLKYAELKTDAETGANECAAAIRAGAKG